MVTRARVSRLKSTGITLYSSCFRWVLNDAVPTRIRRIEQEEKRILISWSLAAVAAVVTAFALVNVAHDGFGLTREEILTRSLTAAAVIGLALATYYFGEKRRRPRDR